MFNTKLISHHTSVLLMILSLLAINFSIPAVALAQTAQIRYAKPVAIGTGDCSNWADACTLQTALTGATNGDEIWATAGTYKPTTVTTNRTATFTIKEGISLYGGFAGTETARDQRSPATNVTILSGDIDNNDSQTPIITNIDTVTGNTSNSYHVVTSKANVSLLDGFTITAGYTDFFEEGGGMYSVGNPSLANISFVGNFAGSCGGLSSKGNATLTNVTFTGNKADMEAGGGMCSLGDPILMNVTFNNNSAQHGGGLTAGNNAILINVTFNNNSAEGVGGGLASIGTLTLTNVTFNNNSAGDHGGGMSSGGNPTLNNVTFNSNSSENRGGGLDNILGNPILTNVTFIDNTAVDYGGGMYNEGGSPTLKNVTFFNNAAQELGGGMLNQYDTEATINNTIFWGNIAPLDSAQIYGISTSVVNDSVIQDGCPAEITCSNIMPDDPLLGTLGDYGGQTQTIPVLEGSSAIDAGNNATCATSDQRGVDRPVGPQCDIGAFEFNGTPRPDTYITAHPTSPTISPNASFTFFSPDGAATFECSLDGAAFGVCSNPSSYAGLAAGTHTLAVRAKNLAGDEDNSPASFSWTIYPMHTAGVRYAAPIAPDSGDCSSWATACALQDALLTSINGDEIWVMAGTHKPTTGTSRHATFQLQNGVALYGGFAGTETARAQRNSATNLTILSGDLNGNDNSNVKDDESTRSDNSYHVVTGANGATLDGFTITAGNAYPTISLNPGGGMSNLDSSPTLANIIFNRNSGGGMYNGAGSQPILTDVVFSDNYSSSSGSGMYNDSSSPTLTNVTFSNNASNNGSGSTMYNGSNSNPTLTNVTFNNNQGTGMVNSQSSPTLTNVIFNGNSTTNDDGGGMNNLYNGNPILTNVTFIGNSAKNGGGMYNLASNPTLTNVTFSGNSAQNGGGMENASSSPTLINVTFVGNTAQNNGGGMFNLSSTTHPILTNVTFSNNSAKNGGGMYNAIIAQPQIRNTIFWGNTATIAGAQIYNTTGTNPGTPTINDSIVQNGCPAGGICTNVISTDPMLGTLGNYGGFTQTVPLLAGSSAIDAGDNTNCPASDQRGDTRPFDGDGNGSAICDMGAYEVQTVMPTPTPSSTGTQTSTPTITMTHTQTNTPTITVTYTRTNTPTPTITKTRTITRTPTTTPTLTSTPTTTNTEIPTLTQTASPSLTPTMTETMTATPTYTETSTPTTTSTPTRTATATVTKTQTRVLTTVTFNSAASYDGWVRESSENSNIGALLDASSQTFQLGDDAAKRQYRSILSFDTHSLPDTAIITKATLKIKQQGIVGGGNPLSIFQGLMVDIKRGIIGASNLQAEDFQSTVSKTYGPFNPSLVNNWYNINLTNARPYINRLNSNARLTQIRLRFKLDDNNNAIANYLSLFSGNAATTDRPQLVINYYVP